MAQSKKSTDIIENIYVHTYTHTCMHTYIQSARDAETIDSGMNMAYDLEQMSFWFSATDAPSVQSRGGPN